MALNVAVCGWIKPFFCLNLQKKGTASRPDMLVLHSKQALITPWNDLQNWHSKAVQTKSMDFVHCRQSHRSGVQTKQAYYYHKQKGTIHRINNIPKWHTRQQSFQQSTIQNEKVLFDRERAMAAQSWGAARPFLLSIVSEHSQTRRGGCPRIITLKRLPRREFRLVPRTVSQPLLTADFWLHID